MRHKLALLIFLFTTLPQLSLSAEMSHVTAELFTEKEQYDPKGSNWIAIRFTMEPDWHVYWKNVGDSGLPTTFDFDLPAGVQVVQSLWPTPVSFDTAGLISYGYGDEATWLFELTGGPAEPEGMVTVEWLECALVCIPGSTLLDISWKGKAGSPTIFEKARSKIPMPADSFGSMKHQGDHLLWTPNEVNAKSWFFFSEDENWVRYGQEQVWTQGEGLKVPIEEDAPKSGNIKGVLTGFGEKGEPLASIESSWILGEDESPETAAEEASSGLLMMLTFAFLGGLLLNVMPCVLPVLSLKIMQLLDHREDRSAWKPSLAYTAGVLISFQALAFVLILLRQGGNELGWGYQLQDPYVICGLISLFLLLGLNMFGVFEIGVGLVGVDEKVKGKGRLISSFGSGALATAAATPCSAPFMGVAIGFALTVDTATNLLIFLFLGLGMAFPFLLVGFIPGALKLLPKPGAWMVTLKQGMGFLLMATVAYLFHVLVTLIDDHDWILNIGLGLVTLSFAAWVYGRSTSVVGKLIAILSVVVSIWLMGPRQKHFEWEKFSEVAIQNHIESGSPVFIDFTASWCTNCKVNERRVLETSRASELFTRTGVIPMKADWSRFDPEITKYLSKLGRNSVPVYAVIDPKRPNTPTLLPEALSFVNLEEALTPLSKP